MLTKNVNGVDIPLSKEEEEAIVAEWQKENELKAKTAYIENRLREYPTIGDQLDMLYHDKIDGTNTFVEAINLVKNKYPKPKN